MPKTKKLTQRQLAVIEDLFAGELDEQAVLNKHNVTPSRYEQWLAEEQFAEQFEERISRAVRQSRMILARYAPLAAAKLVELTQCEKEETVRKTCLDIIALHTPAAANAARAVPSPNEASRVASELSPETASRLLAALAQEPDDENITP